MTSTLEEVEARRAARRAARKESADAQRLVDLTAIDSLEEEHGDTSIAVVEVPYSPGLPVVCAVRAPRSAEIKRYQHSVKPRKDGSMGDTVAAAEALATVCLVYPDADTYAQLREARPGVHVQLGIAALGLAMGQAADDAKG